MSKVKRYNFDCVNTRTGEDLSMCNCSSVDIVDKLVPFLQNQIQSLFNDDFSLNLDIIVELKID